MLYYFKKGKNATEMPKKISAVYGEAAVTDQTCQKWFAGFPGGAVVENLPANAGDTGLSPGPRGSHMLRSN